MKRIDDEIKKRLGGHGLNDFIDRLKRDRGDKGLKGLGKSSSMGNLHRDLEEDERRVNTEPLDKKGKKKYENQPNPFSRNDDPEYPNNCIAVPGRLPKKIVDPANVRTKVIQTGMDVMNGEDFDKDFERRLRELEGRTKDYRKDDRLYGNTP